MREQSAGRDEGQAPARVLTVAGSDSSGGAGIEADIKTIAAFGGYAMTAITALTAQNTRGVFGMSVMTRDFVRQRMELVIDDIGIDAIKTGMLANAGIIEAVAEVIGEKAISCCLVVDPVMIAKGGARLLEKQAEAALVKKLMPHATLVTPNIPEAEALLGRKIGNLGEMKLAAADLLEMAGCHAILLKGGHLDSDRLFDVLLSAEQYEVYESPRLPTTNTHGTGCTLSSAIATRLGQGWRMADAVASARDYVRRAIEAAPGFGHGHGPLLHTVRAD